MATPPDHVSSLTPDEIRALSPRDLKDIVLHSPDVNFLRMIAGVRFGHEASVQNDDPQHPFILWPPINKEPHQPWLPILLASVAKQEFAPYLNGDPLVVIAMPGSATWYIEHIKESNIFPNARFPLVLKERQLAQYNRPLKEAHALQVPSYVHGRASSGEPRIPQTMYFFDPDLYKGANVIKFDDALAEGITTSVTAKFVVNTLGARSMLAAYPMAKEIEGGRTILESHPAVTALSTLISVLDTHGLGQAIDYSYTI